MGPRKSQKIVKTGPKNVTTGMCPLCKTIGRIFIIGNVGEERAKCPACNQEFDLQLGWTQPYLFKEFFQYQIMSSEGEGTVYDRIEKLEDEIATLRNEIDVIKNAFRNELARHEVKMIKKGHDVSSIID